MKLRAFMVLLSMPLVVAPMVSRDVTAAPAARPRLTIESADRVNKLFAESVSPGGGVQRRLLRESTKTLGIEASGFDAGGRAAFVTWAEDRSERWTTFSRDGGETWARPRPLVSDLLLRMGRTAPSEALPAVSRELALPPGGRLFLVQLRSVVLPEWKQALADMGAEVLSFFPHNAFIVRMDRARVARVAALDVVQRVAPYHPAYRLEHELRDWIDLPRRGRAGPARQRVRVMAFEPGSKGKDSIVRAAHACGARVVQDGPKSRILDLEVDPIQLERIAAHDSVMWIGRWSPPESDMNLVRQDSGADWLEADSGYCGQGVRGEVMDEGIQTDHPDFDGIMLHGDVGGETHGTSTYGIVFGNGSRDGDGNALATGMLPCAEQGIFADHDSMTDRFAETEELKYEPYFASFQSNSWGTASTLDYTVDSAEMDDIIWRLDIAIAQSQANNSNQISRPQAWAKNIISVGGIYHQDTLNTSDDTWCNFACSSHTSQSACVADPHCHWDPQSFGNIHCFHDICASTGPAADGRIKPDVSYWLDDIFTTAPGSGYTSTFGGTSAATPQVAGAIGLLVQMWSENVWNADPVGTTVFERQPHFSTIKALLINSAQQYSFDASHQDLGRMHQGWGRPNVKNAKERAERSFVVDQNYRLTVGQSASYFVDVDETSGPLQATMVYPDPPGQVGSSMARVNDLDLRVTSPSGVVYYGNAGLDVSPRSSPGGAPDTVDTVENVFIKGPEPGRWLVEVEAVEVNEDGCPDGWPMDTTFSLVVTGATRSRCRDKVCPCVVDGDCDNGIFCDGSEACSGGECQSGEPPCEAELCHEAERYCTLCPSSHGCAGTSCERVVPDQCTTYDTGLTACQMGTAFHCPQGTTIHITNCACHAATPHAFCASEDQSWDCR